jgi:hypothetical protein
MDIRDKKIVWVDQEIFDIPEAVGITASRDFLGVMRDKMISQLNHLTITSQLIPDLQKEVSILEMYIAKETQNVNNPKLDQWKTNLITKSNELNHLKARKEVLIISIKALERIVESILWELKE